MPESWAAGSLSWQVRSKSFVEQTALSSGEIASLIEALQEGFKHFKDRDGIFLVPFRYINDKLQKLPGYVNLK